MNKIKFLSGKIIRLNGLLYKPYYIGELPPSFAYTYSDEKEAEGISEWFNYKGFTYVAS